MNVEKVVQMLQQLQAHNETEEQALEIAIDCVLEVARHKLLFEGYFEEEI